MSVIDEAFSPKQLARRALIVQAAMETLKRDGIAGCTVRAIAEATPFTKGTIHYYFDDVREIVNTAFLQLTEDYMASVEAVAGEAGGPVAAFWRAVGSYVEGFRGHRRAGLLWFEYSSWAARNGYGHGVASSLVALRAMFARRLEAVDPAATAAVDGMTRCLLGAVLEFGVSDLESEAVIPDIARICGIRRPRGALATTHVELCPLCRSTEVKRPPAS